MKKIGFLLTVIFSLLFFASGQTGAYEVEIDVEKKIYHISELGLPGEMSLINFLSTIPELADRNDDTFLSRYDIKLDDKVVSESKDAFLLNTRLREIECIEIDTSPSEAQIKNGISGSINVVPIPITKGFNGDANVSAFTSGVMPTMNFRYSDGAKFEARADFDFDIYYPAKLSYKEIYDEKTTVSGVDTTKERFFGQLARFYAKWKISEKDALRVWLWQDYSYERMSVYSGRTITEDMSSVFGPGMQRSTEEFSSSESLSKKLALACFVDYKRQLKTGELSAKADYHFKSAFPGKSDEFNSELKSVTKFDLREKRRLNMEVVLNSSVNSNREINDRLYYISPNIKFKYTDERIQAILKGRYKGYSRAFSADGGRDFNGWSQDWTAEANLFWQIVDHHALRLKLIRSTGIAANNLVYPELTLDKGAGVWKKGNPNLKGPLTNSATLEYITDWSNGPHRLVFNIGTELNFVDRMIKNQILYDKDRRINYLYPTNSASSRVADLCAMLRYSYGVFSITAGGNLFYNMEYALIDRLNASYFNIQLSPSLQLKHNWLLSANFIYNSKVYNQDFTIGDSSLLNLRVSKSLNNWTFYMVVEDVFDDISTDIETSGAKTTYTTYDPYKRQLCLGVNFHF